MGKTRTNKVSIVASMHKAVCSCHDTDCPIKEELAIWLDANSSTVPLSVLLKEWQEYNNFGRPEEVRRCTRVLEEGTDIDNRG